MYFLFGGDNYYPSGGWKDLIGIYATLEEAVKEGSSCESIFGSDMLIEKYDWWHVVDGNSLTVVCGSTMPFEG